MNSKEIIKQAECELKEQFEIIDEIRDFNQEKVLNAFIEIKLHRNISTRFRDTGMMIWGAKH